MIAKYSTIDRLKVREYLWNKTNSTIIEFININMTVKFKFTAPNAVAPEQVLPGIFALKALDVKTIRHEDGTALVGYETGLIAFVEGGYGQLVPTVGQVMTSHLLFNTEIFVNAHLVPVFKLISGTSLSTTFEKDNVVAYLVVHELLPENLEITTEEYVEPEKPVTEGTSENTTDATTTSEG